MSTPDNSREGKHVSKDVRQVANGKHHDRLQNCTDTCLHERATCTLTIQVSRLNTTTNHTVQCTACTYHEHAL